MKKVYGCDNTNLTLTKEAQRVYNDISPIKIIEIETDDGYTYTIKGAIEADNMTADEVNQFLVELGQVEEE